MAAVNDYRSFRPFSEGCVSLLFHPASSFFLTLCDKCVGSAGCVVHIYTTLCIAATNNKLNIYKKEKER